MNVRKWLMMASVALGGVLVQTSPLWAQSDDGPPEIASRVHWLAILFAVLGTGIICLAAFKNSRRSDVK